jgi:hypothetical protein
MGEIDRVHSVVRPIIGPRPTNRVEPETDRKHHQPQGHDEVELTNARDEEEAEGPESEPEVAESHGLDLSI